MISTLVSDYAWYWPVICFLAAAAFTALSYYRNRKLADFQPWKIYLLSGLRFLAIFITALLLLNIFVKRSSQRTEKPILAIAMDNSESMVMRGQGAVDSHKNFINEANKLAERLSGKYNVRFFEFGDNTGIIKSASQLDFSHKYTNLSHMLESMQSTLYNTNAGALLICSDGIYNRGQNPVYAATSLGKKIYTVTLGDTTAYCDLAITKAVYNETAFLGNEFPIELSINARMLKGAKTLCQIMHKGRVEYSETIQINSQNFSKSVSTTLKAGEKGLQKYTISLSPLDGEITDVNNTRDILVDVVDDRYKILILGSMPHPDMAAIRNALSTNRGFDIEVATMDVFDKPLSAYNLLVLVQVPSISANAAGILSQISAKNIPTLFVLGEGTDFAAFNSANKCLTINKKSDSFEEVQYSENVRFSLFSFENGVEEFLSKVPPLSAPFGEYTTLPASQIFGNQMVRGIPTDKPLIVVSDPSKSRQAVISGEGIWRWRIDCYKRYLNHEKFDLLISRLCQFLLTRADRERFSITTRRIFGENEPVYFNSKVLTEALEPDMEAQVNIELRDQEGNLAGSYKMEPAGNGYYLRIDNLAPDSYTYTAKAISGGKTLSKSGLISVSEIKTEAENLIANLSLMERMAASTGGKSISPDNLEQLAEILSDDSTIKPVVYSDITSASLLSFKSLFVIIVLLMAAEWFLRKFWGTL
ncbi:MAG: hypothetical protein MJZ61_07035 [Bacteroidales bacterium]|nr:hypothetical protein [Bacteroidales bacterium]